MKVFGADACSDKLVLCCLECFPDNAKEEVKETEFFQVSTDTIGLNQFLKMEPKVVILEPTGVHYIKFWLHHLQENGVEVRLVHNARLPRFRTETLELDNKEDETDAYALAAYYWAYKDNPNRWLRFRDPVVYEMRELCFKLGHNDRITNAIINRLKQVLTHQFPEQAKATKDAPLFWGWVAGLRKSKRYDLMLEQSKGLGITDETRFEASALYHYLIEDKRLEQKLRSIYQSDERFEPYRQVFKEFGFGLNVSAIILTQIFPLEDFLGEDGKPIVKMTRGRYSKKPTKKYISLRKFKKALGAAPVNEWSGKKKKSRRAGSGLARKKIWGWFKVRIEWGRSNSALKSSRGRRYRQQFQQEIKKKRPIQKVRAEMRHKIIKELFYELVNHITER